MSFTGKWRFQIFDEKQTKKSDNKSITIVIIFIVIFSSPNRHLDQCFQCMIPIFLPSFIVLIQNGNVQTIVPHTVACSNMHTIAIKFVDITLGISQSDMKISRITIIAVTKWEMWINYDEKATKIIDNVEWWLTSENLLQWAW